MNKFTKGQKVKIPTTKSVQCRIHESGAIKQANEMGQDYLVVKYYDGEQCVVALSMSEGGDFFLESDLEAYPKFKAGDKVEIPTQKTGKYPGIENSIHVKKAKARGQDHMYIVEHREDGLYVLNKDDGMSAGDFFHERDLTLYEEDPIAPFFYPTDSSEPFFQPFLTVPFDPPTPSTITYKGVDLGEKLEDIDTDITIINKDMKDIFKRIEKLEKTPVAVAGSSVEHVYVTSMTETPFETEYRASVTFTNGTKIYVELELTKQEQKAIFSKNETITQHVRKMFK